MSGRMPALRKDVEIAAHQLRGRPMHHFLVDSSGEGRVFELGKREHFLCKRMDGDSTIEETLSLYEKELGEPLAASDLDAFIEQLRGEGFLEGVPPRRATAPEAFAGDDYLPWARVQITRGDRFVGWLAEHLGWAFTLPARVVAGAVILLGLNTLVREWGPFWDALSYHWGFVFVLTIVLSTSLLVHAPRHLLQAVDCKRGGGYVQEIGLSFMYWVVPGLYCHYTDARWIDDKRRLMRTIATGLWYHAFAWAVAMMGWFVSAPGSVARGVWLAVAFGSGVAMLLVVANPMVQGDGYRLLTTWLELPRLRERALAAFGSWIMRRPAPEPLSRRERRWFLLFGLLVTAFTLGYLVLLSVVAGVKLSGAFEGAGALLALGLAAFLFSKPAGKALSGSPSLERARVRIADLNRRPGWRFWAMVGGALLLFTPYPYETGGPFTILPGAQSEVHCEIDGGRIAEVFVHEGDFVKAGQPLGRIDQREYEKNLAFTQASLEETGAKLDYLRKELAMLRTPPDIESILALEAEARRLNTLVEDYSRELELTTMVAAIDGRVSTPEIQHKVGRYLRKGDLFATVEQAERVRVEIQVPEADAPQVEVGARVKVVAWAYPGETHYGEVREIAPIASAPVYSPAFRTENAVRVIAELPNPELRFKSQTTGFAKIRTDWIPVWYVLSRLVVRFFQVQVWYWIP